jgi:hypothetical protein
VRRVTWKTATDEAGFFRTRAYPCASVPLRVYKRSNNTFDCSDITNVSFIFARVAPTKSRRIAASWRVSKSISLKIMQGAARRLNQCTESISKSPSVKWHCRVGQQVTRPSLLEILAFVDDHSSKRPASSGV